MEEGRVLPRSRYFNAIITLPQLNVRDQPLQRRSHQMRHNQRLQVFLYCSTCIPLMKGLLSPLGMPLVWKKIPPLVCSYLYPPAAN